MFFREMSSIKKAFLGVYLLCVLACTTSCITSSNIRSSLYRYRINGPAPYAVPVEKNWPYICRYRYRYLRVYGTRLRLHPGGKPFALVKSVSMKNASMHLSQRGPAFGTLYSLETKGFTLRGISTGKQTKVYSIKPLRFNEHVVSFGHASLRWLGNESGRMMVETKVPFFFSKRPLQKIISCQGTTTSPRKTHRIRQQLGLPKPQKQLFLQAKTRIPLFDRPGGVPIGHLYFKWRKRQVEILQEADDFSEIRFIGRYPFAPTHLVRGWIFSKFLHKPKPNKKKGALAGIFGSVARPYKSSWGVACASGYPLYVQQGGMIFRVGRLKPYRRFLPKKRVRGKWRHIELFRKKSPKSKKKSWTGIKLLNGARWLLYEPDFHDCKNINSHLKKLE